VDLAPIAEANPEEAVRVSLQPFHDLMIESDLVQGKPYPGMTLKIWHSSKGSRGWVHIATKSLVAPYKRGLDDYPRYVGVRVNHRGTFLDSHEVAGAPNVLCIEQVLSNFREPDRMNNSGGLPDQR